MRGGIWEGKGRRRDKMKKERYIDQLDGKGREGRKRRRKRE